MDQLVKISFTRNEKSFKNTAINTSMYMIFLNIKNIWCFEKSRKHSFVEYSTIKKKNYAQGRRILVQAYKNAKMCVKERKKRGIKKKNV